MGGAVVSNGGSERAVCLSAAVPGLSFLVIVFDWGYCCQVKVKNFILFYFV